MFYDFHRTSVGRYAIFATLRGSYGERVYTQVGRNYESVETAAKAAQRLASMGTPDVTLKDLASHPHRVFYFDNLKAYVETHDTQPTKQYSIFDAVVEYVDPTPKTRTRRATPTRRQAVRPDPRS